MSREDLERLTANAALVAEEALALGKEALVIVASLIARAYVTYEEYRMFKGSDE